MNMFTAGKNICRYFAGNKPIVAVDLDGREDVWIQVIIKNDGTKIILETRTHLELTEEEKLRLRTAHGGNVIIPDIGVVVTTQGGEEGELIVYEYTPPYVFKEQKAFSIESFINEGNLGGADEELNAWWNDKYEDDEAAIGFIDNAGKSIQNAGIAITPVVPPLGGFVYGIGSTVRTGAGAMKTITAIQEKDFKKAAIEGGAIIVGSVGGSATSKIEDEVREVGTQYLIDQTIDKAVDELEKKE